MKKHIDNLKMYWIKRGKGNGKIKICLCKRKNYQSE